MKASSFNVPELKKESHVDMIQLQQLVNEKLLESGSVVLSGMAGVGKTELA